MKESPTIKKKYRILKTTLLFGAVTIVSTTIVLALILEGRRARKENELLKYEVW